MDEDLIAFRSTDGRVGLMEPRCAHRGANLFFGRNEECGIRCAYHGWKYDLDGRCVEMPNVPADAAYHGKMRIKAYPTRDFGEMVWAYLGPADRTPELPQMEFGLVPDPHGYVSKKLQQCNWAQAVEGALDTAHFSFLHMPAPKVAEAIHPDANAARCVIVSFRSLQSLWSDRSDRRSGDPVTGVQLEDVSRRFGALAAVDHSDQNELL